MTMDYTISFVFLFLSTFCCLSVSFKPLDNYLINCGSKEDSIVDNRRFTADPSSFCGGVFTSTRAFRLVADTPNPGLPQIYETAGVFKRQRTYEFDVRERGIHTVRLHFYRLNSTKVDYESAQFHVLVNGYVVLRNFTGGEKESSPRIVEYLIPVDGRKLVVRLVPSERTKFAFINAIEVISTPRDVVEDTANLIKGDQIENCHGLKRQALEVMYRINVGGPKVTSFNDSLWRAWIPDDEFLRSKAGAKKVHFSGRIHYQKGGASREVCPDNVYNSARVVVSANASIPDEKLQWEFPVTGGYKYLLRVHFCDIASLSSGLLFFNLYINGRLVRENVDLSFITNYMIASPVYMDFVVDEKSSTSGVMTVSVGPSSKSVDHGVDAILNGIEIMKMSNSMKSFDGEMSEVMVRKGCPGIETGEWLPLFALVCLLLGVSLEMYRRRTAVASPSAVKWARLPTDYPKDGNQSV